jgi:hypothetical protein
LGVGLVRPRSQKSTLGISVDLKTQTNNGTASLLGVSGDHDITAVPASVGMSFSYITFGNFDPPSPLPVGSRPEDAVSQHAGALCAAECKFQEDSKFCKRHAECLKLVEDRWIAEHSVITDVQLCQIAREPVAKLKADGNVSPQDRLKRWNELVRSCLQMCSGGSDDPFCSLLSHPLENDVYLNISSDELCESGKKYREKIEEEAGKYRPFPPQMMNVGGRVGWGQYKYVTSTAAEQPLMEEARRHASWSVGGSYWRIAEASGKMAGTLELLLLFQDRYQASDRKAKWCVPVGLVAGAAVGATPAEECKEETLGLPSRTKTVRLGARIGLVESKVASWRVAFGGEAQIPVSGDAPLAISMGPMAILSTQNGPDGLKYKGLIRIGPSLYIERKKGARTTASGLLTFTLGGSRTLFSQMFDEY